MMDDPWVAALIVALLIVLIIVGCVIAIEIDDLQTTLRLVDVACP
jgi:hypothetical protein